MSPLAWRPRIRAGFADDFDVLEVSVEWSEDKAAHPVEETSEFLEWEDSQLEVESKPEKHTVRIKTGVLLSAVGVCLGVMSLF